MWSLVMLAGRFIPGLFGRKLADGAAKIVGILVLVIVIGGLLSLGKCAYDKSIINDYQVEERADQAEAAVEADKAADDAEAARMEALEQENDRLEDAAQNAAKADPAGAAGKVGPVTQSYYDSLRKKKGEKR